MGTKLFEGFNLTEGEQEFISNVLKDDKTMEVKTVYLQQAQILASLRYAKELEKASISSDKNAKAMSCLTVALAILAAIQAFWPIILKCFF